MIHKTTYACQIKSGFSYATSSIGQPTTDGNKDKLIKKLKANPKTFLFDEAEALLNYLEFSRVNKGKTSGSRVVFVNEDHGNILLHKPHPQKELKAYQVKQLIEFLEQEKLI